MSRGSGRGARLEAGEIDVGEARLHYRVRGSGPLLLILAGGAGDAESSDRLLEHLDGDYTVLTYDRRGFWRSPVEDPDARVTIQTHADDAHRLLASVGGGAAHILGFSIGALIALELALRHPDDVRLVVAHEPPLAQLLSDAEKVDVNLLALYRREGADAAIAEFARSIGARDEAGREEPGLPQARIAAYNRECFFRHDAPAVARYELDLEGLRPVASRLVIAGGRAGRQHFPYRCAARLAQHLGQPLVEFPGSHAGFVEHPEEFAARLCAVLECADPRR